MVEVEQEDYLKILMKQKTVKKQPKLKDRRKTHLYLSNHLCFLNFNGK